MFEDVAEVKHQLPLLGKGQSTMDKFRESFTKAASAVGLEAKLSQDSSVGTDDSNNSNAMEELSEFCPKLTFKQRVMGFVICYVTGYLVTFSSFKFFVLLVEGRPMPFVISYTFGNILSLLASMFLCGPKRQLTSMMDDKRKYTSLVYISSLLVTIIICFVPMHRKVKLFLLLNLVFVQFCSMVWYNLSYIPFGRRTAKKVFKDFTGIEEIV